MSKADPGSEVIEPYDIPTGGRGRDAEDLHCGLCAAMIFTSYSNPVSADEVLQAGQSRQGRSMSEMHDHQWRLRLSVYFGYSVGLLGFLAIHS
jgi:hypothetical protein